MVVRSLFRILLFLASTAACCATGRAGETATKPGPASDNPAGGAWQPQGAPYPDPQSVPGHEGTLSETFRESFELVCKNAGLRASELRFDVYVDETGHVDIGEPDSPRESARRAQIYMNALFWRQNNDVYNLDRFTGILSINRGQRLYPCEKVGGRKF